MKNWNESEKKEKLVVDNVSEHKLIFRRVLTSQQDLKKYLVMPLPDGAHLTASCSSRTV